MFKALHPFVQSSPIVMLLTGEGDKLRVTVTQKETKKGKPLSLSVLATPDELDAELAITIAESSGAGDDTQAVADQVRAQLESAKPKKASASGSANTTATANARTVRGSAGSTQVRATGSKAERKQACINDYIALSTVADGKPITREGFIEKAGTSRDFERLFGNWTKFKAAAERALKNAPPAAAVPNDGAGAVAEADERVAATEDKTMPLPLDPPVEALPDAAVGEPDNWPFSTTPKDVELGNDRNDTSHGRDVYDEQGNYLSSITTRPEDEDGVIGLSGVGLRQVVSIEGRRIITKPFVKPQRIRDVVLEDGTVVGRETRDLEPGDVLTLHDVEHTVTSSNDLRITVQPPAPPPPPPKVRNVVNDEGEKVGTFTGDPVWVNDRLCLDGIDYVAVRVTEKAIFVAVHAAAAQEA